MTLAVILLVISFATSESAGHKPVMGSAAENPVMFSGSQDQGSTSQTQNSSPTQNSPQTSNSAQTPSSSGPAQPASAENPHKKRKRWNHKKAVIPPDCNGPAPAGATSSNSTASSTSSASAKGASGSTGTVPTHGTANSAPASNPPVDCPPTKTIVRQGGSSEPSIQLVGGPEGDHAVQERAQERDSANHLLESTEENLKKIAGRQLTSSQKDMVSQIRQFMDQSKTAQAAGDVDRAHALALKAQLLSQELADPQQ
jgi:hypothetical protein